MGANVIKMESTKAPDLLRGSVMTFVDNRNQRDIALDIATPEGKEIFLKMLEDTDILIESSKGGSYDKMGLSDEVLWGVNKKLVIVHVSAYGQKGDPGYVKKAGLDGVAQAFSGYMYWNGEPEKPMRVKPYTADMICAQFATWSALAALYRAEKTGVGDSIDLAQFEALLRLQSQYNLAYWNDGQLWPRAGNKEYPFAGCDVFRCKDGVDVMLVIMGHAIWQRAIKLLGLDTDPDFQYPEGHRISLRSSNPDGAKFEKALTDFCAAHNSDEVQRIMDENQLPCSQIFSPQMMLDHPHYKARNTIISYYDDYAKRDIKTYNVIPQFKNNPCQVWCGAPDYGKDSDDILEEIGYAKNEVNTLLEKGVIRKGPAFKNLA